MQKKEAYDDETVEECIILSDFTGGIRNSHKAHIALSLKLSYRRHRDQQSPIWRHGARLPLICVTASASQTC